MTNLMSDGAEQTARVEGAEGEVESPVDRRRIPTPILSRFTLWGRRTVNSHPGAPRRNYYVDRTDGTFRSVALGVCIFIAIDGFATLQIVSHGGGEANPLMAWVLNHSWQLFLAVKIAAAISALVLLHSHGRFPIIRKVGFFLLAVYGAVVLYHLYLLLHIAAAHLS